MRVAGQFAGGQQVGFAEGIQVREAGTQVLRQLGGQFIQVLQQVFQALAGATQTQRVATGQVVVDIACGLVLEGLRQTQVALHQRVRPFECALRPPQRRPKCQAHGYQKKGIQIGQQLQAHAWFQPTAKDKCLKLLRFHYKVMTVSVDSGEKMALCFDVRAACTRLRPAPLARYSASSA